MLSFQHLLHITDNKKAAVNYLFSVGLLSTPGLCSCQSFWQVDQTDNQYYTCPNIQCRKKYFNIFFNTIFDNAIIDASAEKIIHIMYLWTTQCEINSIVLITNISEYTVGKVIAHIKMAVSKYCLNNNLPFRNTQVAVPKIGGAGKRVLLFLYCTDVYYFFGGIEQTPESRKFVEKLTLKTKGTIPIDVEILERIIDRVEPSSKIITDIFQTCQFSQNILMKIKLSYMNYHDLPENVINNRIQLSKTIIVPVEKPALFVLPSEEVQKQNQEHERTRTQDILVQEKNRLIEEEQQQRNLQETLKSLQDYEKTLEIEKEGHKEEEEEEQEQEEERHKKQRTESNLYKEHEQIHQQQLLQEQQRLQGLQTYHGQYASSFQPSSKSSISAVTSSSMHLPVPQTSAEARQQESFKKQEAYEQYENKIIELFNNKFYDFNTIPSISMENKSFLSFNLFATIIRDESLKKKNDMWTILLTSIKDNQNPFYVQNLSSLDTILYASNSIETLINKEIKYASRFQLFAKL